MILSKLSIGIFLLRIVTDCISVRILYAAMILNVLTGVIYFFVTMFQCHPISYFWDKTDAGNCISIDVIIGLGYLYSVLNIGCDFTFALLPIAIVRNLNMPRRLKMVTIPLLSMGCIASAGVVVRLAFLETLRDPDFLCEMLLSLYLCIVVHANKLSRCDSQCSGVVYRRGRSCYYSGLPCLCSTAIYRYPPSHGTVNFGNLFCRRIT